MPHIHTTISGIYPKLIEDANVPHLKRSLHAFDSKELSLDELETVITKNIGKAIEEQQSAGVTLVADPLTRWDSVYSPFITSWDNVERGDLKRIYDTNTLQRRPRITGEIGYNPSTASSDAASAQATANAPFKTILPGPFTFAADAQDDHYGDPQALTLALAKALNQVLREYQSAGVTYIELYDPELALAYDVSGNVAEIYASLLEGIDTVQVVLGGFYGTPRKEHLEAAQKAGVAGVTLDFVTNPDADSWLGDAQPAIVQLGVLDARTTAKDDLEIAAQHVQRVQAAHPQADLWISLNNHTEFLPRDRAITKFGRLKELVN